MSQLGRQAESKLAVPLPSVLFRPSVDQTKTTQTGEDHLLTQSINSNAHRIQKHPPRHTQNHTKSISGPP